MNLTKIARGYIRSVGVLMLAAGMVCILAAIAAQGTQQPRDPVFLLPLILLFCIIAGIMLAGALICLFVQKEKWPMAWIVWLALNFLVYRIGLNYCGVTGGWQGYTGPLASAFGIGNLMVSWLIDATLISFLVGGLLVLALGFWSVNQKPLHPTQTLICWACGGHIKFALENAGRQTSCPHCAKPVKLRREENLKMSCFFCQGHIEFPAYALGTKLPCPHCRKDITLLSPD
jgi:hypothetical protein